MNFIIIGLLLREMTVLDRLCVRFNMYLVAAIFIYVYSLFIFYFERYYYNRTGSVQKVDTTLYIRFMLLIMLAKLFAKYFRFIFVVSFVVILVLL